MLEVNQLQTQLGDKCFSWSFQVKPNAMMVITGGSGVGKSTLLNSLLGFQKTTAGSIRWNSDDVTDLPVVGRPFGVLFQQGNLFEHLSVFQNLAFGVRSSGRLSELEISQVEAAADRFELKSILNRTASDLSGGQQQRVALARVFIQNKPVILLDEPFSSLDPVLRHEGIEWVNELRSVHGTTVLLVTHHLDEVKWCADAVYEGLANQSWRHEFVNPSEVGE